MRFHTRWLVVVAAASLAVACGKKDKTEDKAADKHGDMADKGAGDKGAAMAVEQGGKPGDAKPGVIPPPSDQINKDLGVIPVDSEIVVGFNFEELRKSELWKKFEPMILAKAGPELAKFKDRCGFDPVESFNSITLGMKNLGPGLVPDITMVIHGPDKTKALACIAKSKDEAAAKGTTLDIDGDTVIIKSTKDAKDPPAALMFVDDTTAVMIVNATASKDSVKAAAAGTSALKTSKAFVDMFAKIDTTASLWGLANGSSKIFDSMPSVTGRPAAVFGYLDVGTGLTIDMRVRMDTPEKALNIVNMGKTQIAAAQKMMNKLALDADGSDVHLSLDMTEAQLHALVQQFAGLAASMMGGGGGAPDTTAPAPTAPAGSGAATP